MRPFQKPVPLVDDALDLGGPCDTNEHHVGVGGQLAMAPELGGTPFDQFFDRLREEFQHRYEGLSPHLQRIAHFALGDPNRFALQTVAETARETDVQPSTVIRFAKVFGFSGFSEMQRVFRLRLIEGASSFRDQIHELAARWKRPPRAIRPPS